MAACASGDPSSVARVAGRGGSFAGVVGANSAVTTFSTESSSSSHASGRRSPTATKLGPTSTFATSLDAANSRATRGSSTPAADSYQRLGPSWMGGVTNRIERGLGVASGTTGPSNVAARAGASSMLAAVGALPSPDSSRRNPSARHPNSKTNRPSSSYRHQPSPRPTRSASAWSSSLVHGSVEKKRFNSVFTGASLVRSIVPSASCVRCVTAVGVSPLGRDLASVFVAAHMSSMTGQSRQFARWYRTLLGQCGRGRHEEHPGRPLDDRAVPRIGRDDRARHRDEGWRPEARARRRGERRPRGTSRRPTRRPSGR